MTARETQLIAAGDILARAIGHTATCPKHHPSIPCQCGAGRQQAEALGAWEKVVEQIKTTAIFGE